MARMKRIMVRLSLPMEEALLYRSEQQGQPVATVATNALRGALQRTVETPQVAERIAARRALSTRDDWAFDRAEAIPEGEGSAETAN